MRSSHATLTLFTQPATRAVDEEANAAKRRKEPSMTNSVSINNGQPRVEYPTPDPGDPAEPDDAASANLSPDALMAYCQSRLDSIDSQVRASFAEQQTNASTISQIDQVISDLKTYDGADQKDPTVCKNLEAKFGALIQSLRASDPSCPALPQLTTAYNSMVWSGDGGAQFAHSLPGDPDFIDEGTYPPDESGPKGDNVLSSSELQGYVQTLTDAAGNLNSNSELQMVQLQSLMSQRQTAISLTTNLVQSLGDQENKIADNIGH
jgi:hypothetical protein